MSSQLLKRYKVILHGTAGVGKTVLFNAMQGIPRTPMYIATLGCDVAPVVHVDVVFNVWDLAGDLKFCGLGSEYYNGADLVVEVTRKGWKSPGLFPPSHKPDMTINLDNYPEP